MVSMLALYYDDPSSDPAGACSLHFLFEKNENKQKEAGMVIFNILDLYDPFKWSCSACSTFT